MKLLGKKALVTGAGRGIGAGCALELAREGADVVINDRGASPAAEELLARIRELGRQAELVEGDVFSRAGCEQVVARAIERLGCVDILVSNPARNARQDFLHYEPDEFAAVLEGVLVGGFHISQLVARHMVERGSVDRGSVERGGCGGKIVFISSIHARIPYARNVAYNAGKSGLNHLAFTIAGELARHRINVNVIEPGWIDTPGERATFGDAAIDAAGPKQPWGRLGTPADIGRAAAFLASSDADYITGTTLLVDGGQWLAGAQE